MALVIYFYGIAHLLCANDFILPIFCGVIAVPCLDLNRYSLRKDYFHYLNEQKLYLAFWVSILLICIPVCVGSLIRLYRCDRFCKCKMISKSRNQFGEETPLLSNSREKCHRCNTTANCANGIEKSPSLSNPSAKFSTDIEDLDAIYSLLKSTDQNSDNKNQAKKKVDLELDKYYEGEQHQMGRHVIVILNQVLIMIVCVFFCLWILVDDRTSGIFLEVQLLVAIILSAQIVVVFFCFGFERTLVIDPLLQRFHRYWYGVDEVSLPEIAKLPADEYHICEQFVHYHKERCLQALCSLSPEQVQESSLDTNSSINSSSSCFFGSELVDWLVEVGLVADRITAVHYGNSLLRGRVIRHSEKRYYFRDSNLTYEFCADWSTEGYQEVP